MYIYKITNLINKQAYIGQTVDYHVRINTHCRCKVSNIGKAIQLYGKTNFKFEVLFECSQKDVDLLEMYMIYVYNTYNKGYNVAYKKLTEIELKKANDLYTQIITGTYIIDRTHFSIKPSLNRPIAILLDDEIEIVDTVSQASRKTGVQTNRILEICEGGQRRSAKGYEFRYIDAQGDLIETYKYKRCYRVYVPETQCVYLSVKDACIQLGLDYESNRTNIGHCIAGRHKVCHNYHFIKIDAMTDIQDLPLATDYKNSIICMDNSIFFNNLDEAVTYLGITSSRAKESIREALRGTRNTSYGHTWKYID